jgi:hypothetical protein
MCEPADFFLLLKKLFNYNLERTHSFFFLLLPPQLLKLLTEFSVGFYTHSPRHEFFKWAH